MSRSEPLPGPRRAVDTVSPPPGRSCVVIYLRGELDLSHAELLRERLAEARPTDDVIVDVSAVPFIDSVVLGILARAAVHHRTHARHVVLAGARPFVRKVLAITRLGSLLPDVTTVEQARLLLESYAEMAPAGSEESLRDDARLPPIRDRRSRA